VPIRPFRPEDEPTVVALWDRCGLTRPWNDPRKDVRRKLAVRPDWFLVAEDAGAVVGTVMVGYDGHRGWVYYFGVDPACRRRGVGRALMAEAERLLRAEGCPKVNLQVRAGNTGAIEFYRSLGFAADEVVSLGKRLEPDGPGN
jgi:ribosomal protein S18 acetylase RimI-like enzyme